MRLAILISGSGTTAEAVIRAYQWGKLKNVEPVLVISSNPNALGIEKAKKLGVKTLVLDPKKNDLLGILKKHKIEFVSQNGWLPLTPKEVVDHYQGKIINQHPGPLDPGRSDFGGSQMYGARVVAARIAYEWLTGEKNPWTASTIHFVTEEFDKGDIIQMIKLPIPNLPAGRQIFKQKVTIPELENNPQKLIITTKDVQKKLLPIEYQNVIGTLQKFADEKKVGGFKLKEPLVPEKFEEILKEAKKLSVKLFPNG